MSESSRLALPKPVYIHNRNQVVKLVNASKRRGFPHAAFGAFAITEQHIRFEIALVETCAQGHSGTDAEPLSKRAGGNVNKWHARCGMAFHIAAKFAQSHHFRFRENSQFGPCCPQHWRGMAFGKNEPVIVWVLGIPRIE